MNDNHEKLSEPTVAIAPASIDVKRDVLPYACSDEIIGECVEIVPLEEITPVRYYLIA